MKRNDMYAGYRTPPPPARVVAGCLALALVVGILVGSDGGRLGVSLAGGVVVVWLAAGPRLSPGVPVGGGVLWHASFMLSLCVAERLYWGAEVGVAVFGVGMLTCTALGALVHRPYGRGGVIR